MAQHNRPSEIIYQIYPSSFKDANHDGHGDLKGITEKLDYVKSLGADAIWISPIFLSPQGAAGDGGYAITDYRQIDPRYGTMQDFEKLLATAHEKGLRVYTDFVLCHTSNEHEWFKKSENREPGWENVYVWHDGKRDQSGNLTQPPQPPNNWVSVFGGSAWSYSEKRQQFYLRHFNSSQPALNLNDHKVQDLSLNEMRYWLKKGVDGLRIDALPFANYDKDFRDNPKRNVEWNTGDEDWKHHWNRQDFDHSMCQPETVNFVGRIRKMMDEEFPGKRKIALGEVVAGPWGGEGSMEEAAKYLKPDTGLHTCYTQSLVQFYNQYPKADRLRHMIEQNIKLSPDGGYCNNLGNHDFPRFATRMIGDAPYELHETIIKQLMKIAIALPGSLCLYQGEELGLTQASEDDLGGKKQDAVAIECRDGCRTPMPWESDLTGGFSTHKDPYLPVAKSHLTLAVNMQERDPDSMLHFTRRILHQRQENEALKVGKTILLKTPDPIVAFVRKTDKQAVLCSFNMSGKLVQFKPSDYLDAETMKSLIIPGDGIVKLEAYSSSFHGLKPLQHGVEHGMTAAPQEAANGHANGNGNGHKRSRIFALDMLIADSHMPEAALPKSMEAIRKLDPELIGDKGTIKQDLHNTILNETVSHKGPHQQEVTIGGSTSCAMWTLKKILGKDVDISVMGLAGNDKYGQFVKSALKGAGINLLTDEWPAGIPQETSISHIIKHKADSHTVLTYPGTEIDALHAVLKKDENRDLLEKSIKHCDVVYLPESSISKFGLPLTNKLLALRWQHKKELVLSLPTRANFGPEDSARFKYLIPSCNVVMGNDTEFCRILDKEADRPVSEEQMDRVIAALQAEFKKEVLANNGIPVLPEGQVAFITRGSYQPALLVTKDKVEEIPVARVAALKNILGAGHATFAGFLTGYMKGLPHEQSAVLAMGLAAEKVSQDSPHPHLTDPEKSLDHTLLRGGPMRAIAPAFEFDQMESPHLRKHSSKPSSPPPPPR